MFEEEREERYERDEPAAGPASPLSMFRHPIIGPWLGELAGLGSSDCTNGEDLAAAESMTGMIDRIRALEELKAAASAAQARTAAAFDAATRRSQAAAGMKADQLGKGVGAQIGFARRESPHRGTRLLGLARILTLEMPHTLRALASGVISEWRATILVRETACLSLADRQKVDEQIAGNLAELELLGDRQLIARIKSLSYAMDPQAVVKRAAHAASERFVSCRPAPDTMTYVTALLPVAQGVGVFAALTREADRLRASGDPRTKGQIMADAFVERATGRSKAEDVRVEVQLLMTDQTLLGGSSEPAVLAGYGPVPAQVARDLVRGGDRKRDGGGGDGEAAPDRASPEDRTTQLWLRRLYTVPGSGRLVGMDSKARLVPPGLARFITARDQVCRMPWCGAPIRHLDHIRPHRNGGTTSEDNLQGLCEACNQAKEAPGWSAAAARHTVETRTPTGHVYRSTAPPPPGTAPPPSPPTTEAAA